MPDSYVNQAIWTSSATTNTTGWPFDSTSATTWWCDSMATTTGNVTAYNVGHPVTVAMRQPTTEEVQAAERRCRELHEAAERRAEERRRAEARASERAEQLLLESLNQAQRLMYEQAKKFIVEGGETGVKYEICKGRSININRLDDSGKVRDKLCAHPVEYVPDFDTMLAQKLMLEANEREFLRIANVHRA